MKDTDYAYCVARLRATENKILTSSDLKKLCSFESESEALAFLRSKSRFKAGDTAEEAIKEEKKELWNLISASLPYEKDKEYLCYLNDYFNIKTVIKCIFAQKNAENFFLYPTTLDLEETVNAVKKQNFEYFGDKKTAIKEAYDVLIKTEIGQNTDLIIDKYALNFAFNNSKLKDKKVFSDISAFLCDYHNIKIALRMNKLKKEKAFIDLALSECVRIKRSTLIEKASSSENELLDYLLATEYKKGVEEYKKSEVNFDLWADKRVMEIAFRSIYTSFGFDPICHYYYKRIFELKAINLILVSIRNKINKNTLTERVGYYV